MRIGVSSGGRWWISMGLPGWILVGWIIGPLWLAWHLVLFVVWAVVSLCQAVAAWRQARAA